MPYHKRKTINFSLKQELRLPSGDVVYAWDLAVGNVDYITIKKEKRKTINISAKSSDVLRYKDLLKAKGELEEQGYVSENLVAYMTPESFKDLTSDPDLDSYIGYSRPAIIDEAVVERLAGINIVTSTSAGKMHVEKARPKINISLKGKDETYYVEAIRAGYNNTINFYKDSNYTIPLANPDAYQTLTNKTLDYNDIEEAPIDLISATNRSYALEAINEESKMMLEDDLHFGGWDGSKWRIGRTNMINFNGLKRQTINISKKISRHDS